MAEIQLNNVNDLFNKIGNNILRVVQNKLSYTENLKNDIKFEVTNEKNVIYKIIYTLPSYSIFVDKGRRPGKMPPEAPILSWMNRKNIDIKYIWPIRKKIGDEGIKARPFFYLFEEEFAKYKNELIKAFSDDIAIYFRSNIIN